MPLTIVGLATAMKASNYLMTTINGENCIKDLGYAIGDYIVANALVTYSWHGIDPGPPASETVATTGEIILHGINLTWSAVTVPVAGLTWLASQITTGMRIAQYNITAGGWSTAPLPCFDIPNLVLVIAINTGIPNWWLTARDEAYTQLATQICNWIWAYAPAAPNLGSHGSYTAPSGTGGTVVAIL